MRRAALFLAALIAVPAALQAQKCLGQAPWSSGSMKAGGVLQFGSGLVVATGNVDFGKDQGFSFGAGAGIAHSSGFTQFLITGEAAKELSKPIADKLELCPIATIAIYLPKDGFSQWNVAGGVSVGYPIAMSSSSMGLTLVGSGQLGFSHFSENCTGCSSTDFAGIFGFGAGFVFNERISLVPTLIIPTRGGAAFNIRANVAVGSK